MLSTGLLIGLLWSAWHIAADIPGAAPEWGTLEPVRVLTWMFAGMTPYRILMIWVYRHTGSLFLAVFMHVAYTGVQRPLEPIQATQMENIVFWGLLGVGLWLVVGMVMLADRLHALQRPATPAGRSAAYA